MIPNAVKKPKILETDWRVGAITYHDLGVDWTNYLPTNEKQSLGFDTFGCVTFSALNVIETQINYLIKENKLPETHVKFLKENGYIDENNIVNFSDRFIAKLSGTTKEGNTQNDVAYTIHKSGLIPESKYPFVANSFEEYYQTVPKDLINLGKKFLNYFDVSYEWSVIYGRTKNVYETIAFHLKQAPIQITSPVCPTWYSGTVKSCPLDIPQHATVVYSETNLYNILDQYEPFKKTLAKDYPVLYAMKIMPVVKQVFDVPELPTLPSNPTENDKSAFLDRVLAWLKSLSQALSKGWG